MEWIDRLGLTRPYIRKSTRHAIESKANIRFITKSKFLISAEANINEKNNHDVSLNDLL